MHDYLGERRFLTFALPTLMILGAAVFPALSRDALQWFPLFLAWAAWLLLLPAWAFARTFTSATPLERAGFSLTLALVGLALAQLGALELGHRKLVFAYPLLAVAGSLMVKGKNALPQLPPIPRLALAGGVLTFLLAAGVMTLSPSFFPAKAPILDEHRKTRVVKLLPDVLLHLEAQEEMSHAWPPQFSPAAGVPLRYHLAADGVALALTPPSVPRIAVNCRYLPALWHMVMALNALVLARRYLGATWLAGLFPLLAVFGEDAGWLVPQLELPMVPSLPTFPSFFWFNPNLPGMAVLMSGLAALGWAVETREKRAVFATSALLGGAALFKVFIGAQAGVAVAFAWCLAGKESRKTLMGVLLGLVAFAGLLFVAYRRTFDAPNQHMSLEMLAEMKMSYWFVPVVLGFRILGLGELIRIPWNAQREGPLRLAIVGLVLTGALGLFVRISAIQMTGELGYNNGVWLAVVAKVPMGLLALGAVQRMRFGTGIALAMTAFAVFGARPYANLVRSPEAVAPHVVTADDMDIPAWLERSVPPGTLVVCDPDFPLNLTVLGPYRTPCPQGADFAYSISFMTVAEQGQRVTDAEQFWGEWPCGGLPKEYVRKYGVRWVIAVADRDPPPGLTPVYANKNWAIYDLKPAVTVELAER